jgi:hypothetical protein
MPTSEPWYEAAAADARLTQGDVILHCPVLSWGSGQTVTVARDGDEERLKDSVAAYRADVVVMTQACDLEHGKVRNVVLRPHRPLGVDSVNGKE